MDYRGQIQLPRGIRNNNPFNLVKTAIPWKGKVQGQDQRFETFKSVQYGIRAGLLDLLNDYQEGKNTIQKLLLEFAPPSENQTNLYIQFVSSKLNLSPSAPLNVSDIPDLAKSIIEYENGPNPALFYVQRQVPGIFNAIQKNKSFDTVTPGNNYRIIFPLILLYALGNS